MPLQLLGLALQFRALPLELAAQFLRAVRFTRAEFGDGRGPTVAGGLTEGQTVVIAGVHVLSEGQKVKQYVEPTASVVGSAAAR